MIKMNFHWVDKQNEEHFLMGNHINKWEAVAPEEIWQWNEPLNLL